MPLIVVANLAVGKSWANLATWMLAGLASWGLVLSSALDFGVVVSTSVDQTKFVVDAASIVSGVAAGGLVFKPIRNEVATLLPIDPDNPVHVLALVLAIVLFGTQAASIAFTDVLSFIAAQPPETFLSAFLNEAPLLVIAAAGVGIFIRRDVRASAARLGLVRPAWWHAVLAVAAGGAFLAALSGFDWANHAFLPDLARRVDAVNAHAFSQLVNANWIGVIALAFLPGICEDALFRGALQPRLGLVPTALLFTSIHAQYGLSLDLAGVFAIALCLGLIRKYTNTTTSMSAHVTSNLLASISLAGTMLYVAIGIEAVLVAIVALALWRLNRQGGQ